MNRPWSIARRLAGWPVPIVIVAAALGGCTTLAPYSNASFNQPAPAASAADGPAPRHSFKVDGRRGNDRVLMFLALSGGGSRAAVLSAETMLALQARLEADLLAEVDVVSSVSGGSLAGAYFVASRDRSLADPRLIERVQPLLAEPGASGLALDPDGRLSCRAPLAPAELDHVRRLLPAVDGNDDDARTIEQLCLAPAYPAWDGDEVRKAMSRNYLMYWFGNWFWPANVFRYWTSSFDRSDIMAQTLANNVFSRRGLFGGELTLSDLNPTRPYLLINATNATSRWLDDRHQDDFPFGSVFTFTDEDFRDRICSDAAAYSLPRAVMASSAFPLVFATMTLRDFRPLPPAPGAPCLDGDGPKEERRFLHVFDGGNSDNLGLRSIKRALLQLEVDGRLQAYDRIVVMLVDAFTEPSGAARADPDPRSLFSLLLDTNVSDAVDSLLQSNRNNLMAEFADGELFFERDCDFDGEGLRQLPRRLCEQLRARPSARLSAPQSGADVKDARVLKLQDRLVFFHFGFDDVTWQDAGKGELRRQLDRIPTSFQISAEHTALLREAVATVIRPEHPCLRALTRLVKTAGPAAPGQVAHARLECAKSDLGTRGPARSRRPDGVRR